ncbi:MAG: hypothetical protein ORN83_07055 [Chthoniobacteraceae bacterium]|nr:hypothetical protein [Chthoniobacteraceae bacterium]
MNAEHRALALQKAVLEWQKRCGLSDNDPLLGVVELFQLFFVSLETNRSVFAEKELEEFWDSVELLGQQTKALNKQVLSLSQILEKTEADGASSWNGWGQLMLSTILFAAGVVVARYFL